VGWYALWNGMWFFMFISCVIWNSQAAMTFSTALMVPNVTCSIAIKKLRKFWGGRWWQLQRNMEQNKGMALCWGEKSEGEKKIHKICQCCVKDLSPSIICWFMILW
jgi:hypothetical protein